MKLLDVLIQNNLCATKGEARRLITMGGIKINGEVVRNTEISYDDSDIATLTRGSRTYVISNFAIVGAQG